MAGDVYYSEGTLYDRQSGNVVVVEGSGAVDSVNGKVGVVTLDAADFPTLVSDDEFDAHENLVGMPSGHVPGGGTGGYVLTWSDALGGFGWEPIPGAEQLVTSVNGEVGAVELSAADVDADPAGTAQGLLDTHEAVLGALGHLPAVGDAGDVLTVVGGAWVAEAPATGGSPFGTSWALMQYDTVTQEYVGLGGADPALVDWRWWVGPDWPKNIDGGEDWAEGDGYTPTALEE